MNTKNDHLRYIFNVSWSWANHSFKFMDFPDEFGASLTNIITANKFHELMQGNDYGQDVKRREGSNFIRKCEEIIVG